MVNEIDILVLEDWEPRVDWLRDKFPGLTIVQTLTKCEFVQELESSKPSIVILDHDLGLPDFDGYQACKLLVERFSVPTFPIIVWSQNPVGAQHMTQLLRRHSFNVKQLMFGMTDDTIIDTILNATG